jgi:predicted short-subunit dehydrogenase-like oxidoreductase (DUF2520 family)
LSRRIWRGFRRKSSVKWKKYLDFGGVCVYLENHESSLDVPMGALANTITRSAKPPIALIGTGAVSRNLGRALFQAGYPITAVVGPELTEARYLANKLEADTAGIPLIDIPRHTIVFFLMVPDDQIATVAVDLAKSGFLGEKHIAIHCSGALPADIMAPLKQRGVRLLSFHPMASFTRRIQKSAFKRITIGIEGDREAIRIGFQMANDIGAIPVEIPRELKTTYHLAGVWASNFLVGLISQATSLMEDMGYDQSRSLKILVPLIQGTIDRIRRSGIEGALTGPAMRGDIGTVRRHVQLLASDHPELLAIYRELTKSLIIQLVRDPTKKHQRILEFLEKH